jgi:hypothetical protein
MPAKLGHGTTITHSAIGSLEVIDIDPPEAKAESVPTPTLTTEGAMPSLTSPVYDPGVCVVEAYWDGKYPTIGGAASECVITLPTGLGKLTFNASVEGFKPGKLENNKPAQCTITLKCASTPEWAAVT